MNKNQKMVGIGAGTGSNAGKSPAGSISAAETAKAQPVGPSTGTVRKPATLGGTIRKPASPAPSLSMRPSSGNTDGQGTGGTPNPGSNMGRTPPGLNRGTPDDPAQNVPPSGTGSQSTGIPATEHAGRNAWMNDMRYHPELAGQTVYSNGMNVTYDNHGMPSWAINPNHAAWAGTDRSVRAPSVQAALRGDTSSYDNQYLSDNELAQIAAMQAAAERGEISWDMAHQQAEAIRARYGYSGGAAGNAYNRNSYVIFNPANAATNPLSGSFDADGAGRSTNWTTQRNYWGDDYYQNGIHDGSQPTYMDSLDRERKAFDDWLAAGAPAGQGFGTANGSMATGKADQRPAPTGGFQMMSPSDYTVDRNKTTPQTASASSTQSSGTKGRGPTPQGPNAGGPAFAGEEGEQTSGGDSTTGSGDSTSGGYTPTGDYFDRDLPDDQKAQISQYSAEYEAAKADRDAALARGDTAAAQQAQARMNQAHAAAEAIRARYGYSGGTDGSEYNPYGGSSMFGSGSASGSGGAGSGAGGYGGASASVGPISNRAPDFQSTLDRWLSAAQQQAQLQTDYAVQRGVNELQRAEQDAQQQFQTQRNQIAADEARAKDNQALYNERRGDRGGIGAAQYDSIMNTAAQNRLLVNQAQTKLSTDTARQIADLRAQGQFEKADKLLQLSQTYLQQLISLQQWGAEFNLNVDEFNKALEKWNLEYEADIAQLLGSYRGQSTLASQQLDLQRQAEEFDQAYRIASLTGEYNGQPTLQARAQLAEAGLTLAQMGIMPSQSQMDALASLYGYEPGAIESLVRTAQLAQQAKLGGDTPGNKRTGSPTPGPSPKDDSEPVAPVGPTDRSTSGLSSGPGIIRYSYDDGTWEWNGKYYRSAGAAVKDIMAARESKELSDEDFANLVTILNQYSIRFDAWHDWE